MKRECFVEQLALCAQGFAFLQTVSPYAFLIKALKIAVLLKMYLLL